MLLVDGQLILYDLKSRAVIRKGRLIMAHLNLPSQLVPLPNDRLLRCSSLDGTFHLIDLMTMGDESDPEDSKEWLSMTNKTVTNSERALNPRSTKTVSLEEDMATLELMQEASHNVSNKVYIQRESDGSVVLEVEYQSPLH